MWVRITNEDAPVHKFLNTDRITRIDIDPKEGVRVWGGWDGSESTFFTGKEGEIVADIIETLQVRDELTIGQIKHCPACSNKKIPPGPGVYPKVLCSSMPGGSGVSYDYGRTWVDWSKEKQDYIDTDPGLINREVSQINSARDSVCKPTCFGEGSDEHQ